MLYILLYRRFEYEKHEILYQRSLWRKTIYIYMYLFSMYVLFCVRKIKGLFYLIVLVIGYFVMILFYYLHQRICLDVYNDLFICF